MIKIIRSVYEVAILREDTSKPGKSTDFLGPKNQKDFCGNRRCLR